MQWSKLKTKVKSFICPELKGRIDFHLTSYRESHDGADKLWIAIDGQQVFSCKHYPRQWAEAEAYSDGLRGEEIKDLLHLREIHGPDDFGYAIRTYLLIPVREALKSADPLLKALAVIDRRVGKRTLEKMEISEDEHTLVREFYKLRVIAKQF